jgi:uncharacterized membrane protein YedE/YeeE
VSGLSLSGFVIFFGLAAGGFTGVLFAKWRLKRENASGFVAMYERKPTDIIVEAKPRSIWRQPIMALAAALVALGIVELFLTQGHTNIAVYGLFGLAFGFVLSKSGFCMTASFRDLFTTGGGRLARGSMVAISVAMLGFSILVATGARQPFVLPVGWHTLVGGFIFGLGMVLAGGCATGTLFRVGEGNVQFWFALLGAVISAPLFLLLLNKTGFKMSPPIWLVDYLGWQGALLLGFAFTGVWFLIVQWNEMRMRGKRDDKQSSRSFGLKR